MLTIFRSAVSSINPFKTAGSLSTLALKLLVDKDTGAPVGIQSQNASGPDGIWAPIDITLAQVNSPTAAMVSDLNATYRLNVAPYTRFVSDGTQLVEFGGAAGPDESSFPGSVLQTVPPTSPGLVIGVDSYAVVYSPFTVQNAAGVSVKGRLDVVSRPK